MILTITPNTAIDRTIEVRNFAVGQVAKGRVVASTPAGKGVNMARILSALERKAVVSGFVGHREMSAFADSFKGSHARVELVAVAEPTRLDTTIIDPERNTVTHVRELGFNVSDRDVDALCGKLGELLPNASVAAIAGSLPPGMGGAGLARLMRQCKAAGVRVCVDTSGPALAAAVDEGCTLIKPNDDELGELCGCKIVSPADAARHARKLLDRIEIVLVSMGHKGAVCVTELDAWFGCAPVAANEVVNTVGCGDAFLAGFVAGLDAGERVDTCLRQALACGSAATLTSAAGAVDIAEVQRLRREATIERLEA